MIVNDEYIEAWSDRYDKAKAKFWDEWFTKHFNNGKQMTDFNTLVNTDKIKADVEAAQVQEAKKVEQTPAPVVEPVVI